MSSFNGLRLPPIADDKKFEKFTADLWEGRYGRGSVTLNGRSERDQPPLRPCYRRGASQSRSAGFKSTDQSPYTGAIELHYHRPAQHQRLNFNHETTRQSSLADFKAVPFASPCAIEGAVKANAPLGKRLPLEAQPMPRPRAPASPFRYFNSSPEVIRLVVMMYVRFPLSLRNVEDLLFERGIDICHETVRQWWNRFGPMFAGDIRRQRVSRMRGFRHWKWHLDEMYVKLNGEMVYLWRAVDQEGEILESYITKTRDKHAALRFMKKTLKRHGRVETITTDGLRSYKAAMTELGNQDKQEIGRWANNRCENSHLSFRRRERAMLRFRRMKTLQKFASVRANVHNHFNQERHLLDRKTFKERRSAALAEWQTLAS